MRMTDNAIIGGTGFEALAGFEVARREVVDTPYGEPSAALVFGREGAREWVFLSRHGVEHTIPPHRVNYRANIWALKESGVKRIVALAAVGGISNHLPPESIVIPDQIIDDTWGRAHTFFDGPAVGGMIAGVKHIDFSRPYSEAMREKIIAAANKSGVELVTEAVLAVTQGPRLETAAEIARLERAGANLVGMTAMPEAALARELDIEYATLALVVNPAAGRGADISMEMIAGHLASAAPKALEIIKNL